MTLKTREERFFDKVFYDTVAGCWLYTSSWDRGGYGTFWDGTRHQRAHRWAYEHVVGPIPDGLQLDHLCRVRCCVNPDHLEPVTNHVNVLRGVLPRPWDRCQSGRHLMAESRIGEHGRTRCHPCELERHARYRAAARAS